MRSVVCSVLPELSPLCQDVVIAAHQLLQQEAKAMRKVDSGEGEQAAADTEAVVRKAAATFAAGMEKVEQSLRETVWSVSEQVEQRAKEEVKRPVHSEEELRRVQDEITQLRQRIVNVRTGSCVQPAALSRFRRCAHPASLSVFLTAKLQAPTTERRE
jgi:uncharacterized protein YifE (UPF0438 family)